MFGDMTGCFKMYWELGKKKNRRMEKIREGEAS
jgi:hypothetical protein